MGLVNAIINIQDIAWWQTGIRAVKLTSKQNSNLDCARKMKLADLRFVGFQYKIK
jgi:hypothetical protein